MALINKLTAIADSIREKTGKTNMLTLDQMPLEIAGIQTGVELNFDVVGGTTAPSNPKENTIWVNTSTAISDWYFSANETGKEIISQPYFDSTSKTTNGITYTVDSNGGIIGNGTATANADFTLFKGKLPSGKYTLTESAFANSTVPAVLYVWSYDESSNLGWVGTTYNTTSAEIILTKETNIGITMRFSSGANPNNFRINPSITCVTEGTVWISTGTVSSVEFNALKKNNITVYPMSVKQYVDGAWAVKNAQVYQSGTWKDMQYIIVPNTGTTWTKYAGTASASKTTSATTISITTKASANGTATNSAIYTEFDATQYSTFYVKGSYTFNNTTTSSQVYKIQLLNSSGSAISTIVNKTVPKGTNTGAVAFEKTIDLTSVTGKCKLMFTATTYTTESLTFATTISSCKAY